jgi:dienelactone hydrolase
MVPDRHSNGGKERRSMVRATVFTLAALLGGSAPVEAQQSGKVWGAVKVTEPWEALVFTEAVPRSEYPVDITLLETVDGLFTPIGIRRPKGPGPFPAVLFFSGNGGAGLQQVRDYVNNVAGYTMERFLREGYVVAWLQYRAEAWFAWPKAEPLKVGKQQANQLMSRPPLEIDDLRTIVEYVKRLPYVDPARVGLCGNSHGGGMILRAAADGLRVRAAIVSEPDASEFLQMQEPAFAVENPIYRTPESVAPVLDKSVAMERIGRIDKAMPILLLNRDQDELQGIFETVYLWMKEAGRNVERVSYDHPVHGYIVRVSKDEKGNYRPDPMQLQAIDRAIDFFNKHMAR